MIKEIKIKTKRDKLRIFREKKTYVHFLSYLLVHITSGYVFFNLKASREGLVSFLFQPPTY